MMLHYQHHSNSPEDDESDEAKAYLFNSERGAPHTKIAALSNSDKKANTNTSAVVSTGTRHHLSPKFCYDLNSAVAAAASHSAKQNQPDGKAGRLIA